MKYQQPSFTVPKGSRDPRQCQHGWADAKSRCVFCGDKVKLVFVPRHRWCVRCHKKSQISWNGKFYCAQCLNKVGVFRDRDRKPKPILLAQSEPPADVSGTCDTSGSSSS